MTELQKPLYTLTVGEYISLHQRLMKGMKQGVAPPPSQEKEKELLSIDEASAFTGIPKQSLYAMSSKGQVPCSRRGKRLIFERDKLLAWVREGTKETMAEAEEKINRKILGRENKS